MVDPIQLHRTHQWQSPHILFSLTRVPHRERVLVGSSDFQIYELDFAAETLEATAFTGAGHSSYVSGLALVNQTMISAGYDGRLIYWDLESRQPLRSVDAHPKWIRQLTLAPDGKRLYSVADDMQCKAWDVATGDLVATFSDHAPLTPQHYPSMLYAVAVSSDGQRLATGDRVGHVAIWDTHSFEQIGELEAPGLYTWDPQRRRHSIGGIRSLAFSPDATQLAVGGVGQIGNVDHLKGPSRLEIFAWQSGQRQHEFEDNKKQGLIEKIIWSPDARTVLAMGGEHQGFLNVFDLGSGELLHQAGSDGHIHDGVVDEAFEHLYIAGHQRVERWSLVKPA